MKQNFHNEPIQAPAQSGPETSAAANLFELINDANIDQCIVLDLELRVISWNAACERITGIARTAAIGKTFLELFPGSEPAPAVTEALELALQGYKAFVPWEKGPHELGYFEQHFIPLRTADGAMTGILNIIHDVSHRIKAEEELKRLNRTLSHKNKELKHRSEELASFNWIASHDLREPLRKIYFFIEMVATKEGNRLTDTARSNLRRAQSAVQRMGLLIDDIVTFSETVAPAAETVPVDQNELYLSAKQLHRKTIEDTAAVIDVGTMPAIKGYPLLLQHLWNHMLGNALKFHAEGSRPEVSIRYAEVPGEDIDSLDAAPNVSYHCLSFADNGIGIAAGNFDTIFGIFQRLHPQGTYRGTGMGLAICRKVAEAHGGFIRVQSAEGTGSTFRCYLEKY